MCVCVDAYSGTTGYEVANERYQRFQNYANLKNLGDFPERTAFERYAVKTSEKANMHNHAGLPRTDLPTSGTLEAQEVTTEGVCRLPHAIYYIVYRLSASYILAGDNEPLAIPRMRILRRGFVISQPGPPADNDLSRGTAGYKALPRARHA